MSDILFHRDNYVFSYRVAGLLLRGNKLLLQKPANDTGFAFPAATLSLAKPAQIL
ncbi:MAG: hypothetical protein FWG30_11785 [Eubacteriaceae bacterium]|nr:hypothetical protein [Eubacteriaceae bacterium]